MIRGILLSLFMTTGVFADSPFEEAGALYDQGKFEEALTLYQSIEGQSSALDYNTGNTLMRLKQTPEAIAYYRRALWQSPSDPDIRANLNRAVAQTETVMSPLPFYRKLCGFLTAEQWQLAFITGCWIFAGLGIAGFKIQALRQASVWLFPFLSLMILTLGAGVWASMPSAYADEAIIRPDVATTRFEPLPDATEHFSIPGGSVVKITDQNRNWYKISALDEQGWIPADQVIRLTELGK
ncbi:tetratricopeptide repeat protein [Kiritimatiellaeota bacterium B1221]|nr:tetratricopeptide repeat protein [Kiritimatiellaeota bacterium B1221]